MNGMELAKAYYEEYGIPMIRKVVGSFDRIAAGLAGEGSECFGFDDVFSRDHDFGPGFCIWLRHDDYLKLGPDLQAAYDSLPKTFLGFSIQHESPERRHRVGIMSIEEYFFRYTGSSSLPKQPVDWLRLPENYLAAAVNGQVFYDGPGAFSRVRNGYLAFYPEDIRRKKLAAKTVYLAQAGQYNYARSVQRGHYEAAYMACGEFVRATLGVLYLLNKTYMPFYKWAFRGAEAFTTASKAYQDLVMLVHMPDDAESGSKKINLIEQICEYIAAAYIEMGFSTANDSFMQAHAESLMEGIKDPKIRSLHILTGG